LGKDCEERETREKRKEREPGAREGERRTNSSQDPSMPMTP